MESRTAVRSWRDRLVSWTMELEGVRWSVAHARRDVDVLVNVVVPFET